MKLSSANIIVAIIACVAAGAAHAQSYPAKPVRMVVPFADGEASGHVSRRPARGNDARPPGFIRVAAQEPAPYPVKPIRVIVPFAPGEASGHVSRRPARRNDARSPG